MVTPIESLKDIGVLMAAHHKLGPGTYDLVLEYRFGGGSINLDGGAVEPAMAINVTGLGLRKADKFGPMSIEVPSGSAKSRKSKAKPEA